MKLITFAIPCYNSAEYMDKCIESLLKAGSDAEIIIVDDGSTKDNTAEIADRYQEKYPEIIRAVHQENGGHGEAVNQGLRCATGKYYKVVDSDDWVDESALNELMNTLRSFEDGEDADAIIVNYVYEHVYCNQQKRVSYTKQIPAKKFISFDDIKKFSTGTFLAMHSLVYKTELLRDVAKLELPKHTFYVDNIYVYTPLPYVKKFYYLDVDFYRYFIGRPDQSVNEEVLMRRIDQHIRVAEEIIKAHDLNEVKKQSVKLYKYMQSFVQIMIIICSIYLIKIGDKESYDKKRKLWQTLKDNDIITYKKCKRAFTGITDSNNRFVCWICKGIYVVVRKIFKFN